MEYANSSSEGQNKLEAEFVPPFDLGEASLAIWGSAWDLQVAAVELWQAAGGNQIDGA